MLLAQVVGMNDPRLCVIVYLTQGETTQALNPWAMHMYFEWDHFKTDPDIKCNRDQQVPPEGGRVGGR